MIRIIRKFLCLIVSLIVFNSCITDGSENDINPVKSFDVLEIDNCEYIYITRRPFQGNMAITHKGNCRYCNEKRNNKEHD